ncbi:DUF2202 domain-containing protein [Intrasporangium sp.]|uniref:DUF2202 domain-containing protein n=1 Tax=Intrasporangium sp. TaxID=1925024 RepID=UPI0032219E15
MSTTTRTVAILATTALLGGGAALTASALSRGGGTPAPGVTATSTALPHDVAEQLQHAREGERMARDLYAALAQAHGDARPMSRITHGEDRHFAAVGTVLSRHGVSDPSAGRRAGSYAYPDLQQRYDDWLAKGKASANAAHQVGVELEKWDIANLQKQVDATKQNDVKQLYSHLLEASRHHLSAYQAALAGQPTGPGAGGQGTPGSGTGQGMGQHRAEHMGQGAGQHTGQGAGQHMGQGAGQHMGEHTGQGAGQHHGNGHHGMGASVGQRNGPGA